MKKLLQILSTISLTLTPISTIACGKKPVDDNIDQLQDMIDSTSLITRMLLLGKHENLNFNPVQAITGLYMPNASASALNQSFKTADGTTINLARQINAFKSLNSAALPIEQYASSTITEQNNTRSLYPQYFVKMYTDDFYHDFLNNDYLWNPDKAIINQDNKELLGYNTDLGSLSTYLRNTNSMYSEDDGSPSTRGYSLGNVPGDFTLGEGITLTKNWSTNELTLTNTNTNETITFGQTDGKIFEIAKKMGIYARGNQLASIIAGINNTQSGSVNAIYILNNLLKFVGGKGDLADKFSTSISGMTNPLGVFARLIESYVLRNIASSYVNNDTIKQLFDSTKIDGNTTISQALESLTNATNSGANDTNFSYLTDYDTIHKTSYLKGLAITKVLDSAIDINQGETLNEDNLKANKFDFTHYTLRETALVSNKIYEVLNNVDPALKEDFIKKIDLEIVTKMNDFMQAELVDGASIFGVEIDSDLVAQFRDLFAGFFNVYTEDPTSFSPYSISVDFAQLANLIVGDQNVVTALKNFYAKSTNIEQLSANDLTEVLSILGFDNGVKENSILDHMIKAFTKPDALAYKDYQFLFFNYDKSPFFSLTNSTMNELYELVLKYAINDQYWKTLQPIYNKENDHETLSYTLEYSGVGDKSVNYFETQSNTSNITKTMGGPVFVKAEEMQSPTQTDETYFDDYFNVTQPYQGDLAQQLAYSGTAHNDNRINVDHKYDITWENVGIDSKPYWVISDIKSYIHNGEINSGVGSTTTGDWTQIYFKF